MSAANWWKKRISRTPTARASKPRHFPLTRPQKKSARTAAEQIPYALFTVAAGLTNHRTRDTTADVYAHRAYGANRLEERRREKNQAQGKERAKDVLAGAVGNAPPCGQVFRMGGGVGAVEGGA